jgi:hypothetical protein
MITFKFEHQVIRAQLETGFDPSKIYENLKTMDAPARRFASLFLDREANMGDVYRLMSEAYRMLTPEEQRNDYNTAMRKLAVY